MVGIVGGGGIGSQDEPSSLNSYPLKQDKQVLKAPPEHWAQLEVAAQGYETQVEGSDMPKLRAHWELEEEHAVTRKAI